MRAEVPDRDVFEHPRLRAIEPQWIQHAGKPMLLLRDPLRLTDGTLALPQQVAVLLSLFDGARDLNAIRSVFALRTGLRLRPSELEGLLRQLDDALVLDGPRYRQAYASALAAYRSAPERPPAMAGRVYPADPAALAGQLDAWLAEPRQSHLSAPTGNDSALIRGVICPHIDFARGAPVYADVWRHAGEAVREADTIVIFGTDHHGRAGSVTPTRQRYATPRGALPTDLQTVDAIAAAIGEDAAFEQELNHRDEHAIELAVAWIQHLLDGQQTPLVPLLVGSFSPFTHGEWDAGSFVPFQQALAALEMATAGRRVLVVAAADFAHVGPAFGDPRPLTIADKEAIADFDSSLLAAICAGSAGEFLAPQVAQGDASRVCGLPPIYLTLRYLGGCRGEVTAYDQCPADADFGSLVSVAGVLLRSGV